MSTRSVLIGLGLVLISVVLQTTLLADSRVQPFGVGINLVVLVVIAVVRHLDPEPGVLLGFTAGLLVDLLGGNPLGLWAMSLTVVAYVTVRLRDRAEQGPAVVGVGVFLLTLLGGALFVILGTLFDRGPLRDPTVLKKIVLAAVYNTILAGGVVPAVTLAMRPRQKSKGWVL